MIKHWCLFFYVHPNTMDSTWYIQFIHEEQTDLSNAFLDINITHNKIDSISCSTLPSCWYTHYIITS